MLVDAEFRLCASRPAGILPSALAVAPTGPCRLMPRKTSCRRCVANRRARGLTSACATRGRTDARRAPLGVHDADASPSGNSLSDNSLLV